MAAQFLVLIVMAAAGEAAANDRKLKAGGSHPEAPRSKVAEVDMEGAPGWVRHLMTKMDNVEAKVDGMTTSVDGAVQAANDAKEYAKKVEARIETETKNREIWQAGMEERFSAIEFLEPAEVAIPADPEIQKKLTDIEKELARMSTADPWAAGWSTKAPTSIPAYVGKGGAKGEAKMEKRQRSIVFSNFPEDTKEADITAAIWKTLKGIRAEIDEVFTYSKHDSVGVARFKSIEGMWKYMQENAGNHRHTILGRTIYVNADRMAGPTEDSMKDRAIRKLVRAIIEGNGGDGAEVKKHMNAKYRQGIVIWKDVRVADWSAKEQKLILKGEGLQYQNAYDALMQPKAAE